MNANKLKGSIIAEGLNVEKVSKAIGIDKVTFYRKLANFDNFTIGEAKRIKDVLNLTMEEASEIFLA